MTLEIYNHSFSLPEPTIQLSGKIFDEATSRILPNKVTITKTKTVRKYGSTGAISLNPNIFYNEKNPREELVFYKRVKISISDTSSPKKMLPD